MKNIARNELLRNIAIIAHVARAARVSCPQDLAKQVG